MITSFHSQHQAQDPATNGFTIPKVMLAATHALMISVPMAGYLKAPGHMLLAPLPLT